VRRSKAVDTVLDSYAHSRTLLVVQAEAEIDWFGAAAHRVGRRAQRGELGLVVDVEAALGESVDTGDARAERACSGDRFAVGSANRGIEPLDPASV
jgi:hypothetical protein